MDFVKEICESKDLIEVAQKIDLSFCGQEEKDEYTAVSMYMDVENLAFEDFDSKPKYNILSDEQANLKFIQTFSKSNEELKENMTHKNQFVELAQYIKENFTEPTGEVLQREDAEMVLNILENRYQLISKICNNETLYVLLLNNTNISANAICNYLQDVKNPNTIKYEIYCFNHKDKNRFHPIYVFLNQIGQMLRSYITKDNSLTPESFISMSNTKLKTNFVQSSESVAVFADAFAIAMMREFRLEEYSPFADFNPIVKEEFYNYFIELLKNEF